MVFLCFAEKLLASIMCRAEKLLQKLSVNVLNARNLTVLEGFMCPIWDYGVILGPLCFCNYGSANWPSLCQNF